MAQTSWQRVASDIREAIARGDFAPGSALPKHEDLATQYGVSRPTVHRAITELVSEGLVVSARLHGTWVAHPPVRLAIARYSAVIDPARPRSDLGPWETACAEHGIEGRAELVGVSRVPLPGDVAARLGIDAGTEVIRRDRRMWAGGYVVQLQSAWYPADVATAGGLDSDSKVTGGIYAALVQAGITPDQAREEVGARLTVPSEQTTDGLHIAGRQPVLDIWRTTEAGGQAIEVVHIVASAAAVSLLYTDLPIARRGA